MSQVASQPPGIFICYRRADSGGYARALYERLSGHFGDEQIFMDLDQIEPGEDFVHVIEEAVGSCEILLALIGLDWLASRDDAGRRLDNPHDFVRLEVAAALAGGVSVIPVLVEGAQMPRPQDLPEDVRPLTRRHAFELSDRRWRHDVEQLIGRLDRVLARRRQEEEEGRRREAEPEAARRQAEEAERLRQAAAEEERRRRQAEEAERARPKEEERQSGPVIWRAEPVVEMASGVRRPVRPRVENLARTLLGKFKALDDATLWILFVIFILVPVAAGVLSVWSPQPAGEKPAPDANRVQNANANVNAEGVGGTEQKTSPLQPPPGMVYVLGGEFRMGRDAGDGFERPAHAVTVGPFFIDTYEVHCGVYARVMKPDGGRAGACPQNEPFRAVTGVTWGEAQAFCRTRGKRLPTEAEWEFAARGTDGRLYPWGDEWRAQAANADGASSRVMDVGTYKAGRSPFGANDMVGNAWEWTDTDLAAYPNGKLPRPVTGRPKVIRGGSFAENRSQATATYRGYLDPDSRNNEKTGFRCVKDLTGAGGQ